MLTCNEDIFNIDKIDGEDLRWELLNYLMSISKKEWNDRVVKAKDYSWNKLVKLSLEIRNMLDEGKMDDYYRYLEALWFVEFGKSRKIGTYV
jgi:hypothetical protein